MIGLADAVVDVASSLAASHVMRLADAYRPAPCYSAGAAAAALAAIPAPQRTSIQALNEAWKKFSAVSGDGVALALQSAASARSTAAASSVQVVTTGPNTPGAPVRLTSQVVRQLIDGASSRVLIVSYAAYRIAAVVDALDRAVARGVQIDLILESAEKLDGGGGADAYAKYSVFEWPLDERQPAAAKLHAKVVVVDGEHALMTSANMTNQAFDHNIELGLLCRGGDTASQVARHFDALIAARILRRKI